MSADQYYVEQDRGGPGDEGELPTYDDLAAQNGPNSRFGRWRGWIEKRAAERYADITPEERQRRRERGWDLPERPQDNAASQVPLHIQTSDLTISSPIESSNPDDASVHLPFVSQTMGPSHLKLNQFGSRFLPHATSQIHCILPLMADRLILIGHDEGLSVLDMFPQEWTDNGGIAIKQPSEAQAYPIWRGETIYQMTILELEQTGEGTHQGVVLALVGPEPDSPSAVHKDSDFRALRMYNLGSLTSLARWTVAQKGARPLDLHRPSHWQAQQPSPPRKHRPQGSIARSIKNLIGETPNSCPHPEPPTSYQNMLSSPASYNSSYATPPIHHGPTQAVPEHPTPVRHHSDDSTWDVVEDLPLRWATDFVPLASPGSRLATTSVIAYATWNDKNRRSTGGQLLAIATKNSILLYESPKGERAYRFMKDLYTPLQPKNILFFDQLVQQEMYLGPSGSPGKHHRSGSNGASRPQVVINDQSDGTTINYGTHLALFVVFEKKASWIRVADSAVGEFELKEDGGPSAPPSGQLNVRDSLASPAGSIRLRSRLSMVERESSSKWILPARCELPVPSEVNQFASNMGLAAKTVYLLTRGKRSHLLPCPLPTKSSSTAPLHVIYWRNTPRHVSVRVCHPSRGGIAVPPRFSQQKPTLFQAIAYGEHGMEVYETTVLSLFLATSGPAKGKGRAFTGPYDSIRAEEDLGGETGYLAHGGNWDRADELYGSSPPTMERQNSASSFSSFGSDAAAGLLRDEIGMYGWCRKGSGDYRIFWVGGSYGDVDEEAGRDEDIY